MPLRCSAAAERRLFALLDHEERARAVRFAAPADRRRYVVSHGVLRILLSSLTGGAPHALRFVFGPYGRPALPAGAPHFSLSRSADLALVAVAHRGPVGVDVERIRADLDLAAFARPLVEPALVRRIETLPASERCRAWFAAWTRLEAVGKAAGEGMRERPGRTGAWHAQDLDLDAGYAGAVAARFPAARVACEPLAAVPA